MGEKFSTKTEEEEKAYQKVILYYRKLCVETHKDNEYRFNLQKASRRMTNRHNYIYKARELKKQIIKKEIIEQNKFDKDIELFKKQYSHQPLMCCDLRN